MFLVNPFELLQILVGLPPEHSSALRRRACSGFDTCRAAVLSILEAQRILGSQ